MKNDSVKSIVVLVSICLIVAILLAAVNSISAPVIEKHAKENESASLLKVLPDAEDFESVELPDGCPDSIKAIYRDTAGSGFAVSLSVTSSYSATPMTYSLGISTDGRIVGVELTNYGESKDFGDYPQSYIGASSALEGIDVFSGATYSSNAFKNGVRDAFAVLIEMSAVSEGEKSDEQKTEELLNTVLPGCLSASGTAKLEEISDAEGVTAAYRARNNTGWIFTAEEDGNKLVCAVSATGASAVYDLSGNAVTNIYPALSQRLLAYGMDKTAAFEESNRTAAASALGLSGNASSLTAARANGQFDCVSGIYIQADEDRTAFVCTPYGYNEPMRIVIVLDSDGKIVSFKAASELIQESEYYSGYELDPSGYAEGFKGLDRGSYSDDKALISGATISSNAVSKSIKAAFAAFESIISGEAE